MCAFCPFVQVLSVNVSVFTLTAIAVDRHRAILNPLRYVHLKQEPNFDPYKLVTAQFMKYPDSKDVGVEAVFSH
jgi:hypothetical protein